MTIEQIQQAQADFAAAAAALTSNFNAVATDDLAKTAQVVALQVQVATLTAQNAALQAQINAVMAIVCPPLP